MWSIPANDLCATSVGAWRVRPGARALGAWSLSLCKRRAFLTFSVFRIFITKPHILAFASSRHRRSHSFSTTHARDPLSSRFYDSTFHNTTNTLIPDIKMFSKTLVLSALAALATAQSAVLSFTNVPNPVTDGQAQAITFRTNDTSSVSTRDESI